MLLISIILSILQGSTYADVTAFNDKIQNIMNKFDSNVRYVGNSDNRKAILESVNLQIKECQNYPYHTQHSPIDGFELLKEDIQQGLEQGLNCLLGQGEAGTLHPYHEYQAIRLIKILENKNVKTFQCVQDKTYAYAVANSPPNNNKSPRSDEVTNIANNKLPYPGVIIDTFRLSGSVSSKHDDETYLNFFKLGKSQIDLLRTGKPVRLNGMHRYKNLPSLMFHEMVHWLGHEHTNIYPDITHLYDTCCFGGSDFISNKTLNKGFQKQACDILKDDELWRSNSYRKMRLWRYKEYDQLKRVMRHHYDE